MSITMRTISILLLFIASAFFLLGCSSIYNESHFGELQGTLTAIEMCSTNTCPIRNNSDIYASRTLIVSTPDGQTNVAELKISDDGAFSAKLPPGDYVLDLLNDHLDRPVDLPKSFTIAENKTTDIKVSIDYENNDDTTGDN